MREPTAKTIKRVERILKADIKWAVEKGPGWDPGRGASFYEEVGKWLSTPPKSEPCGVCAIGALCLRRQPKMRAALEADITVAARTLRVSMEWIEKLYYAVGFDDGMGPPTAQTGYWYLSRRLRAYAEKLQAKRAANEASS